MELGNWYKEKFIEDVDENDLKVRILGKVISQSEDGMVVDDGTSAIQVLLSEEQREQLKNIEGKDVLVFGKTIFRGEEILLYGDIIIILDKSQLNLKLYRRVLKIFNNSNSSNNPSNSSSINNNDKNKNKKTTTSEGMI